MKGRVLCVLAILVLAAALLSHLSWARDRLGASVLIRQVEAHTRQVASRPEIAAQVTRLNLRLLRRAAQLDPGEVQVAMLEGAQYVLMGRPAEAERAYRRALELEPRVEVYMTLGRVLVGGESREEGAAMLRKAGQLDRRIWWRLPPELREATREEH